MSCAPRATVQGGPAGGRRSGLTVDIHAHRECRPAEEMMRPEAERAGRLPLSYGNELSRQVNRRQREVIAPKMESVEVRLADMDRMGVDVQAVSIAPYQMYDWAEPDLGREVCRVTNDDLAEAISGHPDRFVGFATVPLQDTALAVEELERCVRRLGFRGVQVATHVDGEDFSSPRLEPFFAKVEELDVVLFIHSSGPTAKERLMEHYFQNILGHPIEATLAAAHLIFGGVMERHPRLKVAMAHGGGYLPAYPARIDHAYHAREDVRAALPRPPGEYLRRFHFDTMVFDPGQLGFLVSRYGADHILLGTDYPYDMGEDDPLGLIGRVAGLGDDEVAAIAGGNAARLLGLAT